MGQCSGSLNYGDPPPTDSQKNKEKKHKRREQASNFPGVTLCPIQEDEDFKLGGRSLVYIPNPGVCVSLF